MVGIGRFGSIRLRCIAGLEARCFNKTNDLGGMVSARSLAFTASVIGLAGSALLGAGPARAVILQGTGLNGPGNTDSHWEVRASGISGSATAPYSAYIYGLATPSTWAGGGAPQTGYTNADGTFFWIGPNPTTATGENPDSRGWIVRQTLNIAQQGYYSFVLNGYSDNTLRLIFNGTVNQTDPLIPVVDGGMAFLKTSGGEPSPFQNLQTFSGIVQLNAGTNTVDLEMLDTAPGRHTGVLVTQADLQPVPAPLPISGAAAAFSSIRRLRTQSQRLRAGR